MRLFTNKIIRIDADWKREGGGGVGGIFSPYFTAGETVVYENDKRDVSLR